MLLKLKVKKLIKKTKYLFKCPPEEESLEDERHDDGHDDHGEEVEAHEVQPATHKILNSVIILIYFFE